MAVKKEKALFIQRVFAYIIDIVLISFAASLISSPFIDRDKVHKLEEETVTLLEDYGSNKISTNNYINHYSSLYYKMSETTGLTTIITIFLSVCYFVVYQVYTGGRTLGKKLMKIRVISEEGDLNYNQMIFRSFIADSILVDILCFVFMMILDGTNYFSVISIFQVIQFVVTVISIGMIAFNKNGYAIHDKISHTMVIRED